MMTRILNLLLILMLAPFYQVSAAERHTYRLIDTADGLPDNEVKAMIYTPDGRLGVRTSSSFSLYDGCEFRSFMPLQEKAYSMPYVAALPSVYVDGGQRVWLKELGHLLVFDLTTETYINNVETLLRQMGVTERIRNFFIDETKDYWMITMSGKLLRVSGGKCERIQVRTGDLRDICRIGGQVWLVYGDGLLLNLDLKTRKLAGSHRLWQGKVKPRDFVRFSVRGKHVWLMWNHGVANYRHEDRRWQLRYEDKENAFITLDTGTDGTAYVSVRTKGLLVVPRQGEAKHYPAFHTNQGDVITDDVETVVCDNGNLVLGLYSRGICLYYPNVQTFPFFTYASLGAPAVESCRIYDGFVENSNFVFASSVWRYAGDNGLQLSISGSTFGGIDFINCYSDSRGRMWIGTFRHGLYMMEGAGVFHLEQGEDLHRDVNYNVVRGFVEDSCHRIWVNYHGGLGVFDEKARRIVPLDEKALEKYKVVNAFAFDKDQTIWAATSNGLFSYSLKNHRIRLPHDIVDDEDTAVKLDEACKALIIDSRGKVWVGMLNGLYVIDPVRRTALRYGKEQGLPNEMIQGIVEDVRGDVWVSTANGLCRFRPATSGKYALMVFDSQNWLRESKFLPLAAAHADGGRLLFGCAEGFYVVDPRSVKVAEYKGHPLLTSLTVNREEILPGREYGGRVILERVLSKAGRIVLRHDENFIALRFSGLNFEMPRHTYYKYRLRGVDPHWMETSPEDGVGRAAYTKLPPGEYEFEVYSAGADMKWSEKPATLTIMVEAPLYATWWAKLIYLLLLIVAALWAVRWKMEQKRKQMENEKYRELEELKYRFFTNISHEFRTLLTLIITPIGMLLRRAGDDETRSQLNAVNKNAGDLLQLVNELLDFRKMEMNGERLDLMSGNLDEFVKYTVHKFMPLSEQKHIPLQVEDKTGGIFMQFDRNKMGKILVNLLSNAFKYTKEGSVSVVLEKCLIDSRRYVRISVKDTGCGIPHDAQGRIFDRFYRVEGATETQVGTGIGLNMVAEYVKLHGGRISVQSEPGRGSCFVVEIPADLKGEVTQVSAPLIETGEQVDKTILVVEDNDEFRNYMVRELGRIYKKVLVAEDGLKGAIMTEELKPDLVVSDVMMPRMSGTDMCRRIKETLQTSHVPVILLTAWSTDEGRAEGYKAGADAYIAKPFDMNVLLARAASLMDKQEKRIRDFSANLSTDPAEVAESSSDEDLLKTVIALIEQNIDNSEYTIDTLARDVLMSRMSLYRKIKALTGQTPADFMRTVRLKLAAQLLETGRYNVSEVCYRTGFASPQNFSKHFKEMFGVLPSQYLK